MGPTALWFQSDARQVEHVDPLHSGSPLRHSSGQSVLSDLQVPDSKYALEE